MCEGGGEVDRVVVNISTIRPGFCSFSDQFFQKSASKTHKLFLWSFFPKDSVVMNKKGVSQQTEGWGGGGWGG